MDLARWIKRHAAFSPDRPAIRFENEVLTYGALADEVETAAGRLRALGIRPGDVVGYLGFNSPLLLVLLFACARLQAILTPLNWRLAAPEHARILRDSAPRAVIVEPAFFEHARELRASMPGMAWIAAGQAPSDWQAWTALATAPGLGAEAAATDAPLVLCYTSGSTGVPKGVVLTQGALFWNAVNSTHMHDLTSADRILTTLPMFHVGGLNILTTPALHAGATVVLHAKFDAGAAIEAIERERITLAVLVPAQLSAMMEHPRWETADLSSLRVITTGSTIVPAAFVHRIHARGLRIIQIYGSTETCPIAAYQRVDDSERTAGAAGLPALHCDIRIVDFGGADVAAGVDGEILVRGPNVMRGYWNLPKASAEALRDGWYHSGDVGHLDAEGYLHVVARKTEMIISGGENIYPAEIENVLMECPDIADASVVGRADPRWGEAVIAVVVLCPGVCMNEQQVLALLDGRIARYKRPREVRFMEALPRTALGKVMKDKLRAAVVSADVE
ncbi:MAG: long-chain fatty acid--CoA ligase [Xanthobacteraceae bacterium]|nr:MAG: long-chain fatty acid--CoA ligase [Xanthobacteraceae bacterium]